MGTGKTNVFWITGLSGAGKSTLSHDLVQKIKARGLPVVFLDGDEMREVFTEPGLPTNHERPARLALAFKYAKLSRLIASQKMIVVVATISMFKEVHKWNRENLPGYIEVYLKVPTEELKKRDPKGIYKRFDNGEVKNVAGLDLIVDEPEQAEIVFEFDPNRKVTEMSDEVLIYAEKEELT